MRPVPRHFPGLALASILAAAPASAQTAAPANPAPVTRAPAAPLPASPEPVAEAPEPPPAEPALPQPDPEPEPNKPIPPEPTPGLPPVPGSPADPSTNEADKRIGVGIDGVFLFPFGEFGNATGAMIGPVLRFGYRFVPPLETSIRAGYLFGVPKDQPGGATTKLDLLPVWVEARWFIIATFTGPYASVAGGLNMYVPTIEPPIPGPAGDKVTELRRRLGVNFGAGIVLSASLPIDIRAQLMLPNLIGQDAALKETTHIGVALSIGYTLQF